MKASKFSLLATLLLIICLICAAVPAVSAETFTEHFDESEYSHTEITYIDQGSGTSDNLQTFFIYFRDTGTNYIGTSFITYVGSNIRISRDGVYGDYSNIPIEIGGYSATLSCDETHNLLGGYTKTYIWINFENPYEIESLQGYQTVVFTSVEHADSAFCFGGGHSGVTDTDIDTHGSSILHRVYFGGTYYGSYYFRPAETQCVTHYSWNSDLSGMYGEYLSSVSLSRYGVETNFTLLDTAGNTIYTDISENDINFDFLKSEYVYYLIAPSGTIYSRSLVIDEESETVSVLGSVLSTADDALIGGATLNFNSSTYQNVSQTLTNGYGLFTLYPDVEYTVSASAENYQEELSTNPTVTFHSDTPYDYYLKPVYGVENGTVQLNFYVSTANTVGSGYLKVPAAVISLNSEKTLITNSAGYAYTILNRSGSISYTITKSGYKTYSRSYTPNWETWSSDTFEEYIILLAEGATTGGVTPVPTSDTRSSNQKAESAMNILFDNIEGIVQLAVVVLIISLISMIAGGGKKR